MYNFLSISNVKLEVSKVNAFVLSDINGYVITTVDWYNTSFFSFGGKEEEEFHFLMWMLRNPFMFLFT
jgi:hypothetical protein